MLPSSRTPEGEPLRCAICGALNNVEVSRPPGDSTCPSCGAHAWLSELAQIKTEIKSQIRTYVAELSALCRKEPPVKELGEFLVSGLTLCLTAYGTMLWMPGKPHGWSFRSALSLIACVGKPDSPSLAEKVATAKHEIVLNARMAERETLVIGVPILINDKVMGVIEVLQRSGSPQTVERGYLRFVKQMADIVAGCNSLTL